MAARSNVASARRWADGCPGAEGMTVVDCLDEAVKLEARPRMAVISSRPKDHVRDALDAIGHGLDVLLEKPLSDRVSSGRQLISRARDARRVLALGTEYAFLPAFHQCARAFSHRGPRALAMRVEWNDPAGDVRHGAAKRRHEETGLLVNLLPHAASIFRIFAPDARFRVLDAHQSGVETHGFLRLGDDGGGCLDFSCNASSNERRRSLSIEAAGRSACIDFKEEPARLVLDRAEHVLEPALGRMNSTLRLELGAFLMESMGEISGTAITADLSMHSSLHAELERTLP